MASVSLNDTLDASVCSHSIVGGTRAYTLTYNKPSDNMSSNASCHSRRIYRQLKSSSIRGIHPNTVFNVFVPPRTTRFCFKRLRELFNCPSFSDSLL